ncbi:MAG: hypothetical protein JWR54_2196 [Mucilaginibacter sp.]|nr:hypothetical protein [Mucilaginibacter sp.]
MLCRIWHRTCFFFSSYRFWLCKISGWGCSLMYFQSKYCTYLYLLKKILLSVQIYTKNTNPTQNNQKHKCPIIIDYKAVTMIYYDLVIDVYQILLPDTKLTEYIIQQVIRSNCSGDLTKVMQCLFNVHRQEVRSYLVINSC